jgi:hypothetical protein
VLHRRLLLLLPALLLLAGLPARAEVLPRLQVPDPTGVVASSNVELLGVVPLPGAVGARFRGNVMYVTGVGGLFTYDVANPRDPKPLGRLALPHFENEDVDLGGNILLISNDAAESTGILYVIDISDPANPVQRSQLNMGGNPLLGGPGHTASCVLDCAFAWVTDGGGIRVIDLRNPSAPRSVGTFPVATGGLVTHDVQRDENGLYWIAGFDGTAAYRVPADYDGKGLGTLVAKTDARGKSRYAQTFGLDDGSTYNDFIHHNSRRLEDSEVVYVTEEDYTRPGCRGAGSFQRWSLELERDPATEKLRPTGKDLTPIDKWSPEPFDSASPAAVCSAHYFDVHDGLVAQGWYQQGVRLLDVSGEAIRQVGYYIPTVGAMFGAYFPPTDPTGSIVYGVDAADGIHVLQVKRSAEMPTVEAPILPGWASLSVTPDPVFGYACRLR